MDHMEISAKHAARAPQTRKATKAVMMYEDVCQAISPCGWHKHMTLKQVEVIVALWQAGRIGIPLTPEELNGKLTKPFNVRKTNYELNNCIQGIMSLIGAFLPAYRIELHGKAWILLERKLGGSRVKWDIRKNEDGSQTIFPCG
jgi:hypothetical protein